MSNTDVYPPKVCSYIEMVSSMLSSGIFNNDLLDDVWSEMTDEERSIVKKECKRLFGAE
jgi:hypothetical protein